MHVAKLMLNRRCAPSRIHPAAHACHVCISNSNIVRVYLMTRTLGRAERPELKHSYGTVLKSRFSSSPLEASALRLSYSYVIFYYFIFWAHLPCCIYDTRTGREEIPSSTSSRTVGALHRAAFCCACGAPHGMFESGDLRVAAWRVGGRDGRRRFTNFL